MDLSSGERTSMPVAPVLTRNMVDTELTEAIKKSQDYLLSIQHPEGYWWGELESNPTMEAEYLLLTYFLGAVDKERWSKLANYILQRQQDDGSWGQYYEAPGDVSTSVECYFALKLAGISPERPEMRKAREFILSKGGVPEVRVFTKIWLALFGQWDWKGTPTMPPELMYLPTWAPFNIYQFSSWARATIVPMTIILTNKPCKAVPEWASIQDLYPADWTEDNYKLPKPKELFSWRRAFYYVDMVIKAYQALPFKPGRKRALRKIEEWTVDHQEADGSWGGIQPPWVYSLIALHHRGYSLDHPVIKKGLEGFERFAIEDETTWRVQACVSPVWDTCLVQIGLLDSGLAPSHPAVQASTKWLVEEQVHSGGDWQVNVKDVEPGGWAFEFANDNYPDVDDAAEVIIALNMAPMEREDDETRKQKAIERGARWMLAMQCSNGGWAAFDKDNDKSLLSKIPFSDFGEALDPPSVDVASHAVEALAKLGYTRDDPAIDRAYKYILAEQEEEGPWFGRWGVNYIYGTGAVLPALEAIGEDMHQPYVSRAVEWLISHQNDDGGWGESCDSYVDEASWGKGPSTPSQTAWALMALMAAGETDHIATQNGVHYLITTQNDDGTWEEPYYTGTGFPGYGVGRRLKGLPKPGESGYQGAEMGAGFMIKYHSYRNCWPLMALGRFRNMTHLPPVILGANGTNGSSPAGFGKPGESKG